MRDKVFFMVGEGTVIASDTRVIFNVAKVYGSGIVPKGKSTVAAVEWALTDAKRAQRGIRKRIANALRVSRKATKFCMWADISQIESCLTLRGGKRAHVALHRMGAACPGGRSFFIEGPRVFSGADALDYVRDTVANAERQDASEEDRKRADAASDADAGLDALVTLLDECRPMFYRPSPASARAATNDGVPAGEVSCKCRDATGPLNRGGDAFAPKCGPKPASACKCSTKPGHFDEKPPKPAKRPSRAKKAVKA